MKRLPVDDGFDALFDAMTSGSSEGVIERQEARGQRAYVASDLLPIEGTIKPCFGHSKAPLEQVKGLGIEIGEMVDDLFVECRLPDGWRKEPTDHSMWSRLLDERGREHAMIFYKAAFYDRHAHISWSCRYVVHKHHAATPNIPDEYSHPYREAQQCCMCVMDTGQPQPGDHPRSGHHGLVLWSGLAFRRDDFEVADQRESEARAWLTARYPLHDDPFAYWEE